MVRVQLHSLACGCPIFLHHLLKRLSLSPLNGHSTLVKNHLTIYMRALYSAEQNSPCHSLLSGALVLSCLCLLPSSYRGNLVTTRTSRVTHTQMLAGRNMHHVLSTSWLCTCWGSSARTSQGLHELNDLPGSAGLSDLTPDAQLLEPSGSNSRHTAHTNTGF